MKSLTMILMAAALAFPFTAEANRKAQRAEARAQCLKENPKAKKSDLKKCVKEKMASLRQ